MFSALGTRLALVVVTLFFMANLSSTASNIQADDSTREATGTPCVQGTPNVMEPPDATLEATEPTLTGTPELEGTEAPDSIGTSEPHTLGVSGEPCDDHEQHGVHEGEIEDRGTGQGDHKPIEATQAGKGKDDGQAHNSDDGQHHDSGGSNSGSGGNSGDGGGHGGDDNGGKDH